MNRLLSLCAALLVVPAAACSSDSLTASQCGNGTHLANGKCIVDTTCGPGTFGVGGLCLPVVDGGLTCGAGTQLVDNACVSIPVDAGAPAIVCGAGTTLSNGQCVPIPADAGAPAIVCGGGTVLSNGQCVPIPADAGPTLTCGAGTRLSGNQCLPVPQDAASPVSCGVGTHLFQGQCLPDAVDGGKVVVCGPGTRAVDGQCLAVPDGGSEEFIVRVGVTTIGADGYSTIPVTVVGTAGDGTPSTATVVLDTSRAGAGTVSPNTVTLTPTGTTVYFTPCSAAASAWCAGPVRITLALASAPNTVVANSQEITLVAPTGIGSDSPCLVGGNVLFFDGDSGCYIYNGTQTITQGKWSASASSDEVHVSVTPTDSEQGLWWDLYFDSSALSAPLTTQVYEGAERWPFQSSGHPGLDVSGDGRGCNTVKGSFQITTLKVTGSTLTSFTATFEHHCEGGTAALRGCVHYGQ